MLGDTIQIIDSSLTGAKLVEYIYSEYDAKGLDLPYIPDHLIETVQMLGPEHFFATEEHLPLPLDFIPNWLQAIALPDHESAESLARDYLFFGESGYGVNSYYFYYYLHWGALYLFYKYPFGGVYDNQEETAARINDDLAAISQMLMEFGNLSPEREHPVVIVADSKSNDYGRGVIKAGELTEWQNDTLVNLLERVAPTGEQ